MTDFPALARRTWHQLEPLHAAVYFSPESIEEAARLGYDSESRWPRYFAYRSAPLGTAGPELVGAAYYSFSPATIREHVPAVWLTATPEAVLEARLRAMDRTFRALIGADAEGPALAEAAELARTAAEAADLAGRPLAAANCDLPWPTEPHLALWQAATVLREHRGDGHLMALRTAGLDACESLVSFAAIDAAPLTAFASRGWTDAEWAAARDRLTERGWLDGEGRATELGRRGRDDIERTTDELAAEPYRVLGEKGCARLAELTGPLFMAVIGTGMLPAQSTLGILTVQPPPPR